MSAKLIKRFQSQVESCQDSLDKFAKEFAKDPAYALAWSNGTFQKAARLQVLKQIVNALENGDGNLDNIRSTMMDRVLSMSRNPAQSTSPTSNLIEQYELAACAEILDDMKYFTE